MKIKTILLSLTLALLGTPPARADAAAYAQILRERDQVLSQILAHREQGFKVGLYDEEAVAAARMALWSFRRDTAATREEKIQQQRLIVAECERRMEGLKDRVHTGIATEYDLLLAKDRWLEAQQVREKLRLDGKGG